jgi:hypothetical protein
METGISRPGLWDSPEIEFDYEVIYRDPIFHSRASVSLENQFSRVVKVESDRVRVPTMDIPPITGTLSFDWSYQDVTLSTLMSLGVTPEDALTEFQRRFDAEVLKKNASGGTLYIRDPLSCQTHPSYGYSCTARYGMVPPNGIRNSVPH